MHEKSIKMNVPTRVIKKRNLSFVYRKMANPAAVARAPVKSLPAVRPRAPLELP